MAFPSDDKRRIRKLKRAVKRSGNKRRRNTLKRQLRANPAEAHVDEEDLGESVSKSLNALERPVDGAESR